MYGIKFNEKGCISALRATLNEAMKDLQDELYSESKARMQTEEGKDDLTKEQITDVADVITASIMGGPWAVMDEYGTGSKMDTANPFLDDYRRSGMWNPARHDLKIRTRPDTPGQIDIFGRPTIGKGKGGIDIEGHGDIKPMPSSKAMQTAMRIMEDSRFKEKILETIQHFPFHSFFIIEEE